MNALDKLNRVCDEWCDLLLNEYIPPGLTSHVLLMHVTTLWPSVNAPQWHHRLFYVVLFICIVYPLSLFGNVFYVNTVEEIIDHGFISLTLFAVAFKAGVMYWQRHNIRGIFRMHAHLLRGTGPEAVRVARINFLLHVFLSFCYMMTGFIFLVQVCVAGPEKSPWPSTTRLPYAFAAKPTVRLAGVMFQTLSYQLLAMWGSMQDAFYIALIHTTCSHVAELKKRLQQLGRRCTDKDNRNAVFYEDLVDCCQRYEDCLSFAKTMEDVLSLAYFAQFGISCLVICSNMYLMSKNDDFDDTLKLFSYTYYLICIIAQISFNCIAGSHLLYESDDINYAIYDSEWIDRDEKCKRAVRILTERSMKPIMIYAGGLFELTLPTFVRICRAAFSYFNILRTMDMKMT